nr:hypothetical protein CFP56_72865 [Quercus suber]
MHQNCQIPGNMQVAAFEKQLNEIDEALKGEAIFSEKPSSAKRVLVVAADLQNSTQSSSVDEESEKWEEKVETWVGLEEDLGSTIGPPGMTNTTPFNVNISKAHETKEGIIVMGQHNPRPQRSNKNIILKGPTNKNNVVGRNSEGKENIDVGTRGQLHGEKKEEHTSMEVEANGVGIKRKERIPLEDISAEEEKGKKQKIDGEVMALGIIMAKHLGSTKIARLQEKLQGLEGKKSSSIVKEEIQETKLELNRMLLAEEDMWQ